MSLLLRPWNVPLGVLLTAAVAAAGGAAGPEPAREHRSGDFVENRGQWSAAARFRRSSAGATGWVGERELRLILERDGRAACVRFGLGGDAAEPAPGERLPGTSNWLVGDDPEAWVLGAERFETIRWKGAWPGVDVLLRDGAGLLAYDLLLAPGADLGAVRVEVEGHAGLGLEDGALVVATAVGELAHSAPIAWQVGPEGGRRPVECAFRLLADDAYGFVAPGLDPRLATVVDPALRWATFLSGTADQTVTAAGALPGGDVVVAGRTESDDYPTTLGSFDPGWSGGTDAFVSRLSPDATSFVWSTYVGGLDDDVAHALAVSPAGAITIVGDTRSTDFPTTPGAADGIANGLLDAFVATLAPSGDVLLAATYLGGTGNDRAFDVAADAAGVVVVGATGGGGFPTAGGGWDPIFNGTADGFAARLDGAGALGWSTYLGGGGADNATAVAFGPGGSVLVAGWTASTTFPTTPGTLASQLFGPDDAFVVELSADGQSRVWSGLVGGSGSDRASDLASDSAGELYLVGTTDSVDFPVTPGALDTALDGPTDGFCLKVGAAGTQFRASTYLGGEEEDDLVALALDDHERPVVAGNTKSVDWPTTPGALGRSLHTNFIAPEYDVTITRLEPDLAGVSYGTYFGSRGEDRVTDLVLDAAGEAVFGGITRAFDFPATEGVVQPDPSLIAASEGFAARLAFLLHPIPYGQGKPSSFGGFASIYATGFPSVSDDDLSIAVDSGYPNKPAILFRGVAPLDAPFFGGRLYVRPPLTRYRPFKPDPFGYGTIDVPIDPAWVGSTMYFQLWFKDPFDPWKVGLTNGLEVRIHP